MSEYRGKEARQTLPHLNGCESFSPEVPLVPPGEMIRVIHYHPLTTHPRLPVVRPDQVRHGMGLSLAGGVRLGVEVHHGVGPLPPGVEELLQDGVPEDQLPHAVDEELRLSPELLSSV